MVPMNFLGKTVVVTGATSGIGAQIARQFAMRGANLVLTGRRELPVVMLDRPSGTAGKTLYLAADITQPQAGERLVEDTIQRFGQLDVLVNNAGILFRGDALACSDEEWDLTLSTNVTAAFRLSRAAVRAMLPRRSGAIVNVASDWGLVGARNAVAYGVSKGALVQLTRSMALDHASHGLRINAVCPGDTDTQMLDSATGADRSAGLAMLGNAIPMGRVGQPEEVANAVCFLASDEASFINGAMLAVDGGNSAG